MRKIERGEGEKDRRRRKDTTSNNNDDNNKKDENTNNNKNDNKKNEKGRHIRRNHDAIVNARLCPVFGCQSI